MLVRSADKTLKITSEFFSQRNPMVFLKRKVNVLDFGKARLRTCR